MERYDGVALEPRCRWSCEPRKRQLRTTLFRQNAARSPVCGIFRFALFITVFGTAASIVKSVLQFLWCLSAAPAR